MTACLSFHWHRVLWQFCSDIHRKTTPVRVEIVWNRWKSILPEPSNGNLKDINWCWKHRSQFSLQATSPSWYLLGVKNSSDPAHKTGSWYLLGVKNTSSHTHKTGSWYLLGVKNPSSHTHKTGSWYLLWVWLEVFFTPKTGSWYLFGVKNTSSKPTKQDLGTS